MKVGQTPPTVLTLHSTGLYYKKIRIELNTILQTEKYTARWRNVKLLSFKQRDFSMPDFTTAGCGYYGTKHLTRDPGIRYVLRA
jgi:hypothetical protein